MTAIDDEEVAAIGSREDEATLSESISAYRDVAKIDVVDVRVEVVDSHDVT